MGDAAFLLIATRPDAALVVLPLSLVVGVLSGWIVDRVNKVEFRISTSGDCRIAPLIGRLRPQDIGYLRLAAPGLYVGAAQLAQVDIVNWRARPLAGRLARKLQSGRQTDARNPGLRLWQGATAALCSFAPIFTSTPVRIQT